MKSKRIFMYKRLDRIAPKADRAYITAACVLCAAACVCAALSAAFSAAAELTAAAAALNAAAYSVWLISAFITVKEVIRNRFFSAVILLAVNILCLALTVTATALIVC